MKHLFATLCAILLAQTSVRAFTVLDSKTWQTDGSVDDVQAAVNVAVGGGTVLLPPGRFSWNKTLSIKGKAIHLKGAGGGRIIARSRTMQTIGTGTKTFTTQANLDLSPGQTLRICRLIQDQNYMEGVVKNYSGTNLEMEISSVGGSGEHDMWWIAVPAVTTVTYAANGQETNFARTIDIAEDTNAHIEISGIRFTTVGNYNAAIYVAPQSGGKAVLIHDCWFSPRGTSVGLMHHSPRGVIWNCSADDNFSQTNCFIQAVVWDGASWQRASTMGALDNTGQNNIYIEDCTIVGFLTSSDFSDNARVVVRHCVSDNNAFGTHGADTGQTGLRHAEFYDNEFVYYGRADGKTVPLPWAIYLRGGTAVITNNIFPNMTSTDFGDKPEIVLNVQNIRRNGGPYACWGANTPGVQYPSPHQVGLGHDGTKYVSDPIYMWGNSDSTIVASAVEYGPNECGAGADTIADYVKPGRDYFTDNNTPKPDYTKYTYPHPLRKGGVSSPSNLRLVPSPTPTP